MKKNGLVWNFPLETPAAVETGGDHTRGWQKGIPLKGLKYNPKSTIPDYGIRIFKKYLGIWDYGIGINIYIYYKWDYRIGI